MRVTRSSLQGRPLLLLTLVVAAMSLGATAAKTVYSNMPNKELKQRAFRLVKSIRELVDAYNKRDRELMAEYDKKNRPEIRIDERKATRDQWIKESDRLHDATMRRYRDQYLTDALLLVDELYRRLPKRLRRTDVLPLYQHPTNVLGLEAIANHLELLGKSLPDA